MNDVWNKTNNSIYCMKQVTNNDFTKLGRAIVVAQAWDKGWVQALEELMAVAAVAMVAHRIHWHFRNMQQAPWLAIDFDAGQAA